MPRSEQTEGQSVSEVSAVESDPLCKDASDSLAAQSGGFNHQAFDGVAGAVARRDDEEVEETLEDKAADDDFAAIQSHGASIATIGEGGQAVSADFRGHSSPSVDARISRVVEETPKMREPDGVPTGDNARRGRRIAARILAAGALASACIFASKQFETTAWLIETVQKVQAQHSFPLPNSSGQPKSSIEFIGDGKEWAVAFESDSNRDPADDLDPALRVDEGIGSVPVVDRLIGHADRSAEYLETPDGEAASTSPAVRSNSEGTDVSVLEASKIDGGRNAPSENQSPDGAKRVAMIATGSELASSSTANPEGTRAFELGAAVVERNVYDAKQSQALPAFGSSFALPPDEQAFSETADDIEERLADSLAVGTLQNVSDDEMPEQSVSLSRDGQSSPSQYSALPLSNDIESLPLIPDASGKSANAAVDSSIFDNRGDPSSADLNSFRSEIESGFAEIHSRFDLMDARLDLLFADHEPVSALRNETIASGIHLSESDDDASVASKMNRQHSPNRSGQSREASLRTGEGFHPYLIATARNAAGGEFIMPEQGYGVVLDVSKDGAGGWLIVMENAILRLD